MISGDGRYAVFDFETTGLSPARGGRVIEVGAVAIEDGRISAEFHSMINPGVAVSLAAQRVHGISEEMLESEPKPEDVFPQFLQFIDRAVLVAHNASFDMGFLRWELENLGLGCDNSHLCTLKICRKLFPRLKNHKLETVARHLIGPLPQNYRFHRALDDAQLTARVWMKVLQEHW
jgi:DNA polymerase III subunit epsilon